MGINAHYADRPTDFEWEITRKREAAEDKLRAQVRDGDISLDFYMTEIKGIAPHLLPLLRPKFHKAIFG